MPSTTAPARAAALVLAPVAMAVAVALVPAFDRTDKAEELAAVAAHPDRWQGALLLELLAAVLLLAAVPAVAAGVRGRGAGLLAAGRGLVALGAVGLACINALNFVLLAMTQGGADRAAMVALTERIEQTSGFTIVLVLLFALSAGFLALAAGARRAGHGPAWAPALIVLSQVVTFLAPAPVSAAGFVLLAAGLAPFAAAIAGGRAERRAGARLVPAAARA